MDGVPHFLSPMVLYLATRVGVMFYVGWYAGEFVMVGD
jgi:hypothetical protein